MIKDTKANVVLAQAYRFEGISQVNPKAAGVDIGAQEIVVCVVEGGSKQWVKTFGTYTIDLKAIALLALKIQRDWQVIQDWFRV